MATGEDSPDGKQPNSKRMNSRIGDIAGCGRFDRRLRQKCAFFDTMLPNCLFRSDVDKFIFSSGRIAEWVVYMITESIVWYVDVVLRSYCTQLRKPLGDSNFPLCIILDNHSSHNREEFIEMFMAAHIIVIWLHDTPLTFSKCWLGCCSVCSRRMTKTFPRKTQSRKLKENNVRALQAWHGDIGSHIFWVPGEWPDFTLICLKTLTCGTGLISKRSVGE
jgi:hypothetical protein